MIKKAFIVPYFGKFPPNFQYWLDSCSYNKEFDWLIFTDCNYECYDIPKNVKTFQFTFLQIEELIKKKYSFQAWIGHPYKLCDYRGGYGEIFSNYLKDYQFWGFCDVDLVFGNLSLFITDNILRKYDIIGGWGHCTLFRNSNAINALYRVKSEDIVDYQKVFQSNCNYLFDEEGGLRKLYKTQKLKVCNLPMYDCAADKLRFTPTIASTCYINENVSDHIIVVNHGQVLVYGIDVNGALYSKEVAYAHFAKRSFSFNVENKNFFAIIPNKYVDIAQGINCKLLKKLQPRHNFYLSYHFGKIKGFWSIVVGKNKVRWPGSRLQLICDVLFHREKSF